MSYQFLFSICRPLRRVRPGLIFGIGLSLAVSVVPVSGRAQAADSHKVAPPVSPAPSASGGLLGQIGRELSDILLQNRAGVVMIRGHRLLALSALPGIGTEKSAMPGTPPGMLPIVPIIGSGFLVQGNIVVTTAEVAEGIQRPVVILSDGKRLRVTASSVDMDSNLAILTVEGADGLHALQLGNSSSVQPGMLAVTIGTQAGFSNSSGLAFIAQTRRRARSGEHRYENLIQFQGAIGPGSSGSPLLGPNGEVIGIVMAAPDMNSGGRGGGWPGMGRGRQNGDNGMEPGKFDKSHGDKSTPDANAKPRRTLHAAEMQGPPGGSSDPHQFHPGGFPNASPFGEATPANFNPFSGLSSIGFALPINDLRDRLPQLVKTAQKIPAPAWMGVQPGNGAKPGAYVTNFYEGNPAAQAGLEIGDIITQVDGQPIRSASEFIGTLVRSVEGRVMKVQILRGGVIRKFEVRLRAFPDPDELRRMNLRQPVEVGVRIAIYFSRVA